MRLGPKLEDYADQLQVVITAFAFVLLITITLSRHTYYLGFTGIDIPTSDHHP